MSQNEETNEVEAPKTRDAKPWWKSAWKLVSAAVGLVVTLLGVFGSLVELDIIENPLSSPIDKLINAGAKLTDAGSARLDITRVITVEGDRRVETGHAEFDFRRGLADAEFTNGLKIRILTPFIFEKYPDAQVWCRFDLSDNPLASGGLLFGAITGFELDPGAAVRNLEEFGDAHDEGDEVLFGVPTTHFSGEIDVAELADATEDQGLKDLLHAQMKLNPTIPTDVWVGKTDDRIVQIAADVNVAGSELGLEAEKVGIHVEYRFSQYGTKVKLQSPPPKQIADPGKKGCFTVP